MRIEEEWWGLAWASTAKALEDWVEENGCLPWGYTTDFEYDEETISYKLVTRILSEDEVRK